VHAQRVARFAIRGDGLEDAELARVAQPGQRAHPDRVCAGRGQPLDPGAQLGRLVAAQRGEQTTERLDRSRGQRAGALVVGRWLEQWQQVIERAAIAERAEREQRG
jgi:hypothetical protein